MNRNLISIGRILDFAAAAFCWFCAIVFGAFAAMLIYSVFQAGLGQIDWAFITGVPQDSGRAGGIAPVIVSTSLIMSVCLAVTVPLGLGTAIYLSEYLTPDSSVGRWVRTLLDILAGVPSIVFGLFGNAFFCLTLNMGYSILSGGLTLACMVLPIFIRVAESAIRDVPEHYRRSGMALGISKTTCTFQIVLPAALPGLLAAFTLGLARALAETAALIFTSGYVTRYPESLFDSGRSLSVHIYDLALNVTGGNERAFATASVLVVLLLAINSITYFCTKVFFDK